MKMETVDERKSEYSLFRCVGKTTPPFARVWCAACHECTGSERAESVLNFARFERRQPSFPSFPCTMSLRVTPGCVGTREEARDCHERIGHTLPPSISMDMLYASIPVFNVLFATPLCLCRTRRHRMRMGCKRFKRAKRCSGYKITICFCETKCLIPCYGL